MVVGYVPRRWARPLNGSLADHSWHTSRSSVAATFCSKTNYRSRMMAVQYLTVFAKTVAIDVK